MTAPTLTGFEPSISLDENTVNATPRLLDPDVTFGDLEGDFNGGVLTLSGLLAEDRASVRNEGTGAGQIGLNGTDVTYGGVIIGTLAGGVGGTLTITFNASATSAAIDALIQNLTYANVSNSPTASRALLLNIADATGADLGRNLAAQTFAVAEGAANPFDTFGVGTDSAPALIDLDGDSDLDLVTGVYAGNLRVFRNDNGSFPELTGAANPFNGIDVGGFSTPTFGDLDGDGDLDMVVGETFGALRSFRNDAGVFTELTGGANPLGFVTGQLFSAPTLADIDGDGDRDLVMGDSTGALRTFRNDGGAFSELLGAANPLNGIDVGLRSAPALGDLDGDGDLDLVVGDRFGTLQTFRNDSGVFSELTGAANPFAGIDVGYHSAPTFGDVDGDGDIDLVVGDNAGALVTVLNTTPRGRVITVGVTAQNDLPTATGVPTDAAVIENAATRVSLSGLVLADLDVDGPVTLTLTAAGGVLTTDFISGEGITISGSGTASLTFTGPILALNSLVELANLVRYTGATDVNGDNADTITVTVDDGPGPTTVGTINVDITAVNDAPAMTGFGASAGFAENTANATPQLLDADVAFTDPEGNFTGGVLTLSGLLAEDRVSVRNEGTGAGQIGLSGADVTFGGVVIGTLAGGVGATLTVTLNASATSAAVDALIQNLTYANVSNTPTATRDLVLNVADSTGASLFVPGFASQTGADNPFTGVDVGFSSRPTLADLDGDGDLDIVAGSGGGNFTYLENTGTATAPVFVERTGAANPLNGIDIGSYSGPVLADVDGDGDLDMITSQSYGSIQYFENTGTVSAAEFTQRTGAANPFEDLTRTEFTAPALADLDGDGDLDLIVGIDQSELLYFENTGSASAPTFVERSGAQNPFAGIVLESGATPFALDLDGDGDLDLIAGGYGSALNYLENVGTGGSPHFLLRPVGQTPFDTTGLGAYLAPTAADLDGDGDLDIVIGRYDGTLGYLRNTTPRGQVITVSITAEGDTFNGTAAGETLTGATAGDIVNGLGGDDTLIGGAGVQTLNGGDNDDTLRGLGGNDALTGGAGSDTADYSTAAAGVSVRLASNVTLSDGDGGVDTLNSIENVIGSALADQIFGDANGNALNGGLGADTLLGLGGNDTLIGGEGSANTLQGGLGDDTYVVIANDTVTEFAGEGTDTVQTTRATYTLGNHLENLLYTGASSFVGIGNGLANVVTGGSGNDTLRGLGGNDVLNGGAGLDTADYSTAAAAVSVRLAINATFNDGDGGSDTLNSIENATGSAFNDLIFGGANANVLNGGLGSDILLGLGGNDTLIGGAGAANTLQGGLGDDTYVVTVNDTITEFMGEGTDTVQTDRAFYTLSANVENLTYTGAGPFHGTGNAQANVITGGGGSDTLTGGQGDDTLNGGGGLDYVVLSGVLANYTVTDLGGGSYRIVDSVGGRDGTDVTTGIERVRFATGPTVALSSLAQPAPAPLEPVDKAAAEPQVLPGLSEDDFVLAKGGDLPEVLPGLEDLFGGGDTVLSAAGAVSPWLMLSVDQDGTSGQEPDAFAGVWNHGGWNHDAWSH